MVACTPANEGRFWKYVVVVEDCWEWLGWTDVNGYGMFAGNGHTAKKESAHRVAFRWYGPGAVPAGLELDHLCRNHRCVNPSHLEAVTHRENVLRGISKAAENANATHCSRGHAFTAENTIHRVQNGRKKRQCRTCTNTAKASRKRKARDARAAIAAMAVHTLEEQ